MAAPQTDAVKDAVTGLFDALRAHPYRIVDDHSTQQSEIATLETLRELINIEIRSRIDGLAAAHNAPLPIHNLPAELFIEILFNTLNPLASWHIQQTMTLTRVSQYWRNTVHASQRFWLLMDFERHPVANEVILNRNTSGPLSVKCCMDDWRAAEEPSNLILLEHFLKEAALQRARWKSVKVSWVNQSQQILPFLEDQTPTPRLEELFLEDRSVRMDPEAPHCLLPQTSTVCLRRLSLLSVSFSSWNLWPCSTLESLTLGAISHSLPSVRQFHAVLYSSPELRHLELFFWSSPFPIHGEYPALLNPIQLPHLRSVVAESIPGVILRLLASIDAPKCLSTRVWAATEEEIKDGWQICIPAIRNATFVNVIAETYQPGDLVSFQSSPPPDYECSWEMEQDLVPGFSLKVPIERSEIAWRELINVQGVELPTCLRLGPQQVMPFGHLPNAPWFSLTAIGASTHIRCIRIGDYVHAEEVLQYLATTQEDANGTTVWPFPNLFALDLRNNPNPNAITQTLSLTTQRYSRAERDQAESGAGLTLVRAAEPRMLREIGLPDLSLWDEVKAVFRSLGVQVIGPSDTLGLLGLE